VIAAVSLLETAGDRPAAEDCAAEAKRILEGIGLDEDTIGCICHVLRCYWAGKDIDTVEFRIVADSRALATLAAERGDRGPEGVGSAGELKLRTKAGKRKIQALS
jgi:hypothetical protein